MSGVSKSSARHALCGPQIHSAAKGEFFLLQPWGVYQQSLVSWGSLGIMGERGSVGLVGLQESGSEAMHLFLLSCSLSLFCETHQKRLPLAYFVLSGTQLLLTENNHLTRTELHW